MGISRLLIITDLCSTLLPNKKSSMKRIFNYLLVSMCFSITSTLFCQSIFIPNYYYNSEYWDTFSKLDKFVSDEIISTHEFLGIKVNPCLELFSYNENEYNKYRTSPIVSGVLEGKKISIASLNTKRRHEYAFSVNYKKPSWYKIDFKTEPITTDRVVDFVNQHNNSIGGVHLAGVVYIPRASLYPMLPYDLLYGPLKKLNLTPEEREHIYHHVDRIIPKDDVVANSFPTLTLSGFFYVFALDNYNLKYSRYFQEYCKSFEIPYVRGEFWKDIRTGEEYELVVDKIDIDEERMYKHDPRYTFEGSLAKLIEQDKNYLKKHKSDFSKKALRILNYFSEKIYNHLSTFRVYSKPVYNRAPVTHYLVPADLDINQEILDDFEKYVQEARENIRNKKNKN